MQPGSVIDAILPGGAQAQLCVKSITGNTVTASCGLSAELSADTPSEAALNTAAGNYPAPECLSLPPVYLFQALPKGTKMDLIVRQAAEAGVSVIVPFVSEFSQVKIKGGSIGSLPGAVSGEKQNRWERIIREARQQSGSDIPTIIKKPLDFDGLMEYWQELQARFPGGTGILFHQTPLEPGTLHDYLVNSLKFIVLAVGPEGGFSAAEAARFLSAGFKPIVLGKTVLRTETAALYAAAAVFTILSERTSWLSKKNLPQ